MRLLFVLLVVLAFGCDDSVEDNHIDMGEVPEQIKEASGLVASHANPGFLWTLNDGGNPSEVFLIDTAAQIKIVCKLPGIQNRDWEDIALGNGPDSTKRYVYIADIGDNLERHKYKYIYRFAEPELKDGSEQVITNIEKLTLTFPDGKRDSETIMVDPLTNDLYLISKREDNVNVYLSKYPFQSDTLKMQKVMSLPLTLIIAGSISPDGQEVLMKNYKKIYYWKRAGEKSLLELLSKAPQEIPYEQEHQGEAICWNKNATAFYTLSESSMIGERAKLRYYKREK